MHRKPIKSSNKPNSVFHFQDKNSEGIISVTVLKQAEKSGKLNLSNRELVTWPDEILKLGVPHSNSKEVDLENSEGLNWWELEPLRYLDMSSNSLKTIPATINELIFLDTLLLQQNIIESLPKELGDLKHLTKLNLSHNKISEFPTELSNLKELRVLSLSDNSLKKFPDVLYDLVMLNVLDLSKNEIAEMSPGIGFLTRLTHLNLSQNKLTSIPSDITSCRGIQTLNLSNNKITSEGLPELVDMNVQIILLQYNEISVLPRLRGCSSLKELHLGFNKIEEITLEELSTLSHLQIINLRNNSLKALPKELGCLKSLVRLDLSFNDLTALPPTLSLLPHLEILLVEGNAFRTIRRDILSGGTPRLLSYLRGLLPAEDAKKDLNNPLSSSAESELPDRYSMKSSRAVNLASKEFYDVPDSVFEEAVCVSCNLVDLSKNRLVAVPKGVWLLSKTLNDLNLSRNRLLEIPQEIGLCINLRYLNVANNHLTSLPKEFSGCSRLRELNISFNRFEEIPECVYEFSALEILNLCDNKITSIDGEKFLCLKVLAVLDLTNNDLTSVPPLMGKMTQLRSFKLDGNGLRALRPAILAKGTEAVLAWLRDKIPQN